jgi:hypothetical protein
LPDHRHHQPPALTLNGLLGGLEAQAHVLVPARASLARDLRCLLGACLLEPVWSTEPASWSGPARATAWRHSPLLLAGLLARQPTHPAAARQPAAAARLGTQRSAHSPEVQVHANLLLKRPLGLRAAIAHVSTRPGHGSRRTGSTPAMLMAPPQHTPVLPWCLAVQTQCGGGTCRCRDATTGRGRAGGARGDLWGKF